MIEIEGNAYTKVDWKDYLLPENNPNIVRFLRTNGVILYKQIVEDIKLAVSKNRDEILLVIHKNSVHIVSIERKDFDEVLDYILHQFLKIESYEECAIIRDLKLRINEK